jgi:hypothetical protein
MMDSDVTNTAATNTETISHQASETPLPAHPVPLDPPFDPPADPPTDPDSPQRPPPQEDPPTPHPRSPTPTTPEPSDPQKSPVTTPGDVPEMPMVDPPVPGTSGDAMS